MAMYTRLCLKTRKYCLKSKTNDEVQTQPTILAILSREPARGSHGRMTRSRNSCCGLLRLLPLLLLLLLLLVFNLQRNSTERPVCMSLWPHLGKGVTISLSTKARYIPFAIKKLKPFEHDKSVRTRAAASCKCHAGSLRLARDSWAHMDASCLKNFFSNACSTRACNVNKTNRINKI